MVIYWDLMVTKWDIDITILDAIGVTTEYQ